MIDKNKITVKLIESPRERKIYDFFRCKYSLYQQHKAEGSMAPIIRWIVHQDETILGVFALRIGGELNKSHAKLVMGIKEEDYLYFSSFTEPKDNKAHKVNFKARGLQKRKFRFDNNVLYSIRNIANPHFKNVNLGRLIADLMISTDTMNDINRLYPTFKPIFIYAYSLSGVTGLYEKSKILKFNTFVVSPNKLKLYALYSGFLTSKAKDFLKGKDKYSGRYITNSNKEIIENWAKENDLSKIVLEKTIDKPDNVLGFEIKEAIKDLKKVDMQDFLEYLNKNVNYSFKNYTFDVSEVNNPSFVFFLLFNGFNIVSNSKNLDYPYIKIFKNKLRKEGANLKYIP